MASLAIAANTSQLLPGWRGQGDAPAFVTLENLVPMLRYVICRCTSLDWPDSDLRGVHRCGRKQPSAIVCVCHGKVLRRRFGSRTAYACSLIVRSDTSAGPAKHPGGRLNVFVQIYEMTEEQSDRELLTQRPAVNCCSSRTNSSCSFETVGHTANQLQFFSPQGSLRQNCDPWAAHSADRSAERWSGVITEYPFRSTGIEPARSCYCRSACAGWTYARHCKRVPDTLESFTPVAMPQTTQRHSIDAACRTPGIARVGAQSVNGVDKPGRTSAAIRLVFAQSLLSDWASQ